MSDATVAEEPAGQGGLPLVVAIAGRAAEPGQAAVIYEHEGYCETPGRFGIVEVNGNSLAPVALKGQRVLVDVSDRTPKDGNIVVLETTDGATYVKRYYEDREHNRVTLTSINPADGQSAIRLDVTKVHRARAGVGVLFE
jgi:phage repressor protein C with HTH and peptisase S24 domain